MTRKNCRGIDIFFGGARWLPLVALIAAPIGCAEDGLPTGDEGEGAAVTAEAEIGEEVAAERPRHGKGRRHGRHHKRGHGMRHHDPAGKLLKTALAELELSDEQRTALEGLRDKAHESRRGWHKGDKPDRHQMLIAALEGGEIDESACQARHQAKSEKIEQHLAARDERLATLHTTLTAEQRTALVEKVRARMADHGARIGEKAGRHGGHGRHHRGHHGPRMLKKLTAGLELSDEQQAAIDALVEQAEARRPADEEIQAKIDAKHARIVELLDAFADEGFDPAKLTKPEPMRQMAERHGCHKDQLEGLIEILTPEQRAELVEQIKAKPFGKRGCRGKGDCDGMGDCGRRGREHGPRDGSGPRAETGDCPYAAD